MKKILLTLFLALVFYGCTETGGPNYEPIYLNETDVNALILWRYVENDFFDTVFVESGDSSYAEINDRFPLLQENGLRWSEKSPLYDVKLVFYPDTDSSKCLSFEGEKIKQNDIRSFSSYENIGRCDFCVTRGEYVTYGMLYRITEDMLNEAVPCD
jgi:hypothetical protein